MEIQNFVHYERLAQQLERDGMYHESDEHDACGTGLVAAIDGKPKREIVRLAIDALKAVWHRGAINADGMTGDGAGIHIQIPQAFFREYIASFGKPLSKSQQFAVGMVFLPRQSYEDQEAARVIVEREIMRFGYRIHGWRQVGVNPDAIGPAANETRPEIAQIIIVGKAGEEEDAFERHLYVIRKSIEKKVLEEAISGFSICSLSCRSIIYKGLFQAAQLESFYPDLADERFISAFAIFHQRFSTNTAPMWSMAQPFTLLAHNGEINTVKGNIQWMKSHEASMSSELFGDLVNDIRPVIPKKGSDTAMLNAAMELLVHAGRSLPLAKMILIPPAWSEDSQDMPSAHKALFNYCNSIMSPWDGPAAIVASDGKWAIAGMDRNGLRPMRYSITADGLLLVGSETGMVPTGHAEVLHYGHLGPGEILGVDFTRGMLFRDRELKDGLASEYPYESWVQAIYNVEEVPYLEAPELRGLEGDVLKRRQIAVGLTYEDIELILTPMVITAKEAVGSMGDDTPIALLAKHYRGLHQFFRQNFSQVTNPPIDSIRERHVMTLTTRIGNKENILGQSERQTDLVMLPTPIVFSGEMRALRKTLSESLAVLDVTYAIHNKKGSLQQAIEKLLKQADDAFVAGQSDFLLTDEAVSESRVAIPMILAVSALHAHLTRKGTRKRASILVSSAECMDTHHFAVLIGVGATAVNPYLSEAWIASRFKAGGLGKLSFEQAVRNYRTSLADGMLKIMAKMGISVIGSYRGGSNFEAIGLSRSLVAQYFPGLKSRISGIGMDGIQNRVHHLHQMAFDKNALAVLPIGGFYNYRVHGELHAHEARNIALLQAAVSSASYRGYKNYSQHVNAGMPINLRDLLDFIPNRIPISLDEVESVTDIRKRFVAPAMSMGALSPEAHETLAVAMNRMGASSNSGEGGEAHERFLPRANGDNANSAIKQVASGRFGVTAEYLNHCREIQIKVAQGAKPGEGGQLPAFKVTELIAELRHATVGVSLISPPPHHDIYSIEDLTQLIYDLKQINPDAIVSVKLVSQSGIGTIASGVVKAMADKIVISGHAGGTGASPQSSIKYAGAPFEMGLAEAQQVLMLNRLRHRVVLQTDGGIRTGRDVVIAAMLGAEEYAVGTLALIALGCLLVRQCHSNTCPVGICTQDEELRKKFEGNVERVINLFTFMAEEVREILARLGVRRLEEVIGRPELLHQVNHGGEDLDTIDLGPLLVQPDQGDYPRICTMKGRNAVADSLDVQMMEDARDALTRMEKIELSYTVNNTYRTIGTRLSSMMVRTYDLSKLQEDHITVRLRGSAGQSLGAFGVRGLKLEVRGDANDYVGKGLSGAMIIVRPRPSSSLETSVNTIIGNTCLYGATSGTLFAAGRAGERFGVRNSGALAVIEGLGTNGCEYMTGGTVVVLGDIGHNFAAGMSGGMAFIYDPKGLATTCINPEMVVYQRIASKHWESVLKQAVEAYVAQTHSRHGENILIGWEWELQHFWQICPKEMVARLHYPLQDARYGELMDVMMKG